MRLGIATCANLPEHEHDDEFLLAALAALGVDAQAVAWDRTDVDWSDFDACLIRSTWDYVDRRADFVSWARSVEAKIPLFNSAATIAWNTHKSYLADLERDGVPVIPTHWCERGTKVDVGAVMAERGWSRGFLKPGIGLNAIATLRFDVESVAAAQTHLERHLATGDMLLQPYLDSVEQTGELSLIVIDGELTHAVRKVPVPGDYRVQDDHGASDEPYQPTPTERRLAHDIVRRIDPQPLYARVDLLRDHTGAPRLTELELVEPSLFFRHAPEAAHTLACAVQSRL